MKKQLQNVVVPEYSSELLQRSLTTLGSGVNQDNIIISYFKKGKIVESVYFVNYTMSGNSFINLILTYSVE